MKKLRCIFLARALTVSLSGVCHRCQQSLILFKAKSIHFITLLKTNNRFWWPCFRSLRLQNWVFCPLELDFEIKICWYHTSLHSVSVWFGSKERPRNWIFGFSRARNARSLTLIPCSLFRNRTETLPTQASMTRVVCASPKLTPCSRLLVKRDTLLRIPRNEILTLQAPISTYKFCKLISVHFLTDY